MSALCTYCSDSNLSEQQTVLIKDKGLTARQFTGFKMSKGSKDPHPNHLREPSCSCGFMKLLCVAYEQFSVCSALLLPLQPKGLCVYFVTPNSPAQRQMVTPVLNRKLLFTQ